MLYRLAPNQSYILHESASEFSGSGTGWLSLKLFRDGSALYSVGRARYAVDDRCYLLLNHGQPYTVTIEAEAPVESFCIFFAPGFADDVRRSLTAAPAALLTDPQRAPFSPASFWARTYPHDRLLSPTLARLRHHWVQRRDDPGWIAEQLHETMLRLLHTQTDVLHEIARVPAARPATRAELYRRLCIARDYAAALYASPLTLADIADAAGLSPNHLLRTFKQTWGQTPHQWIIQRRIEGAKTLLATSDQPVTAICFAVGFGSLGTFSTLFKQREGMSPSAYRRQTR